MAWKKNLTADEKKKLAQETEKKQQEKIMETINKFFDNAENTGSFVDKSWTKENLEPLSFATGEKYKGYNTLYLTGKLTEEKIADNRFITQEKVKALNADWKKEHPDEEGVRYKFKKGSTSSLIKFVKPVDLEDYYRKELKKDGISDKQREKAKNEIERLEKKREETGKREQIFTKGYHNVFAVENIENLVNDYPPTISETNKEIDKDLYISYLIKAVSETTESPIMEGRSGGAFNMNAFKLNEKGEIEGKSEYIQMPPRENFVNDKHYLGTLLHEEAHSIREFDKNSKLHNKLGLKSSISNNYSEIYSFEEIIAETTAGFTMIKLGLDTNSENPNENIFGTNKNYIQGWSSNLRNLENVKEIFEAISAEVVKRSDKLLEKVREYEKEYSFEEFVKDMANKKDKEKSEENNGKGGLEDKIGEQGKLFIDNNLPSVEDIKEVSNSEENPQKTPRTVYAIRKEELAKYIEERLNIQSEIVDVEVQDEKFLNLLSDKLIVNIEMENVPRELLVANEFIKRDIENLESNVITKAEKILLSDDSVGKLVGTLDVYNKNSLMSGTPFLTVVPERVVEYARNVEDDISDTDLKSEYATFEEEYIELLEDKSRKLISMASVYSGFSLEDIEGRLNDKYGKRYENLAITGTENQLVVEKTIRDLSNIITTVEKYELYKELGKTNEIDIDKFANRVIENINKDNKELITTLKEETYDKTIEIIINTRENRVKEFKEFKETEINKKIDKMLEKAGMSEKVIDEEEKTKAKDYDIIS